MAKKETKPSPTWLIILLSAIILFLVLLITGVRNNKVINSLKEQIIQLQIQLEQTEKEKEQEKSKVDDFKEKIESLTSTPSAEPSPESTNSAIFIPEVTTDQPENE